jgi:hypothetical protein
MDKEQLEAACLVIWILVDVLRLMEIDVDM